MKEIRRILGETKPLHPILLLVLLLAIIVALLGLITPWLYRELINFLITEELSNFFVRIIPRQDNVGILIWLVVIYFLIDIISSALTQLRFYIKQLVRVKVHLLFVSKSLQKLHGFSVNYFEKYAPGWLNSRVMTGSREVFGVLSSLMISIIPLVIKFVIAVVVLFIFNKTLALVFAMVAPIYVAISIWRACIMRFWQKKIRNQFDRQHKVFVDNLFYHQLIKEFCKETYECQRLKTIQRNIASLIKAQAKWLRFTAVLRDLVRDFGYIWVYGYGGYLVLQNQLLVGDLILFVAYLNRVFGPLSEVMEIYDDIQVGLVSINRLFKIWDHQEKIVDLPEAKSLKVDHGAVEFKNVSFDYRGTKKYKGERVVFKNISFSIKPREVIALVGPSGVGKSTLVKLLLRFYDPTHGQILIDGQNIREVTQKTLRKNISVIMQDVMVFSNTINYNIGYSKNNVSEQQIVKVSKVANLYNFIMSLRKKFLTQVGQRGVKLSGGEKQRLAIARALLKDAPILIMDEATSALDSENEEKIQDSMWQLIKDRTTIIVAHRLSTIKRADRIIVLDKGRIIQQGNHQELMKQDGYYRKLFMMQGEQLKN